MIHLFVMYYKSIDRQKEIDFCLNYNINNKSIDFIYIITNENIYNIINNKCIIINDDNITFNKMFNIIINQNIINNDIIIFCNSDIIIDEKSILLTYKYLKNNTCYALSRYNLLKNINYTSYKDMLLNCKPHTSSHAQDTWIFNDLTLIKNNINNKFNYHFGTKYCDNVLAYELNNIGYNVENPSLSIYTFHYHLIRKPYSKPPVDKSNGFKYVDRIKLINYNDKFNGIQIKSNDENKLRIILDYINNSNYSGYLCVYTKNDLIHKLCEKSEIDVFNYKKNELILFNDSDYKTFINKNWYVQYIK